MNCMNSAHRAGLPPPQPPQSLMKWNTLTRGVSNQIDGIYALDLSNVYVGGAFVNAGGSSVGYIARWG